MGARNLAKMNNLYEELSTKLFLDVSIDMFKEYLKTLALSTFEKEGVLYSKEHKLYTLCDEELETLQTENYKQQRYMRRCEDAVADSSEENKSGFYQAWDDLEEEDIGIQFESSRRKFLKEWKDTRSQ